MTLPIPDPEHQSAREPRPARDPRLDQFAAWGLQSLFSTVTVVALGVGGYFFKRNVEELNALRLSSAEEQRQTREEMRVEIRALRENFADVRLEIATLKRDGELLRELRAETRALGERLREAEKQLDRISSDRPR